MTSPARGGRRWRAVLATATAGALVGAAVIAAPLPAQAAKKGGTLKVMSQNLYLGADLFPAVEAAQQGGAAFLLAAAKVYQTAIASDFPLRAAEFAKTVKEQDPDIIGLQEVTNWVGSRNNEGPAVTSQDFLAILQSALKAEGLKYKVVAVSENANIGPFPYIDPSINCVKANSAFDADCFIALEDRDVILVNSRTDGLSYKKSSVVTGLFKDQQTFSVGGVTQSFSRGYAYVDMTYNGAKFRFANTHLEVGGDSAAIQTKQAKQFVKIVKKGAGTVIATGDFNTDAYGNYSPDSYKELVKYFTDAWKKKRDGAGLTCCQNATLSNATSENETRIDLVLLHGNVKSKAGVVPNDTPFRTTPAPLWESDHSGVVATVQVK